MHTPSPLPATLDPVTDRRPPPPSVAARLLGAGLWQRLGRGLALLAAVFALYYGGLGWLLHRIDADPAFAPAQPIEGGSRAVDMAAALIEREVEIHRWTVNDPWIYPTAFLDNMPNFQQGIMRAISRFGIELLDRLGRTQGSAAADADLERAVGLLQFPGDVWYLDFEKAWLPVLPSESQYSAGLRALRAYNARLAEGGATFQPRADVLAVTLARISADLGSRTALVDRHVQQGRFLVDSQADDIFYLNKGMLYANYLILRELGRDFESVIATHGLQAVWRQAIDSLRYASQLQPAIVLNAPGDDSIFANHLFLQGFYIKRAILQLDEVGRVLSVRG